MSDWKWEWGVRMKWLFVCLSSIIFELLIEIKSIRIIKDSFDKESNKDKNSQNMFEHSSTPESNNDTERSK